ncbi:mannose-1-phosphate guanyltransferase [Sterolibacterium denitrificans]|uniref:mannose-1-phosphate guanylyltransferase n=1 Tax=Sterolibacterium denitrificans TaxID=157592 RepID=A0A7Z7HPQ9_9PROT|nr:mannose-1-phosphate guanylyltransferase/mannose-6-phosphate isomerase [Sterolibacterium denitrificans]SMB22452.1 mannose-1-phosphate guanyltransferase [Sterolibacterium denitrificans]
MIIPAIPVIPVILSGGAGTRLWPVSREGHPKPFIRLADGESLLHKTYRRAAAIATQDEIVTVTNRDHYFLSKDEFLAAGLGEQRPHFLLEPCGRNTAPAIAAAALALRERYGDAAIMVVMAADHLIRDEAEFAEAARAAAKLASEGHIVTFGIRPDKPETGFGYIECGSAVGSGKDGAARVQRFVEKPDAATAAQYLTSGRYLWNSGMFCFSVGVILAELERHAPDVLATARTCIDVSPSEEGVGGLRRELDAASFSNAPDISIDYAVMERSDRVVVIPAAFDWSDIGSWSALQQLVAPDADGNRALGEALFVDCANTFVQSENRLIAAVGLKDLILIDTPDAVLAVHPDHVQDVRKIVQQLKTAGHDACKLHRTVARPWGTYTVLEEGRHFKIKRIVVKPGAALSLQLHHHRSEHWIVVQGMAKVTNGDSVLYVNINESTYIPAGHKHRLENPGLLDLVMIEVQSGEYLGEDDIVRFADQYGRGQSVAN